MPRACLLDSTGGKGSSGEAKKRSIILGGLSRNLESFGGKDVDVRTWAFADRLQILCPHPTTTPIYVHGLGLRLRAWLKTFEKYLIQLWERFTPKDMFSFLA